MKKILAIVLAMLFVAGVSSPCFAEKAPGKKGSDKNFERIVAQVVSVDIAAKTMVVTREENGESRTVTISEKAASQLHVGDRVRIKLKAGTNESAGVRVLGAKPSAETPTDEAPVAASDVKAETK